MNFDPVAMRSGPEFCRFKIIYQKVVLLSPYLKERFMFMDNLDYLNLEEVGD